MKPGNPIAVGARGGNAIIYLDHLASTPIDPCVFAAMAPWLSVSGVGNPHSSHHRAGWRAAQAVEHARASVAALIGASADEIVFTSGATEANNLALFGAAPAGWTIIVSAIEHSSILGCLPALAARRHKITILPVDRLGFADCGRLERELTLGPALVSVMSANNEVGTLQPLDAVATLCRKSGALLHIDAAQSLSTAAIDVEALGADLLSLSGHKIYGPMGIGALFVRRGLRIAPLMFGGGQQGGVRPGTVPVAPAVGLGAACQLAADSCVQDTTRLTALRERLYSGLAAAIPGLGRNSPRENCLPGCLNVSIQGIDAADLLLDLPDIALSTGSACGAGGGPSHVLAAMGLTAEDAHASIRFGLGRSSTGAEIGQVIIRLSDAVAAWRKTQNG